MKSRDRKPSRSTKPVRRPEPIKGWGDPGPLDGDLNAPAAKLPIPEPTRPPTPPADEPADLDDFHDDVGLDDDQRDDADESNTNDESITLADPVRLPAERLDFGSRPKSRAERAREEDASGARVRLQRFMADSNVAARRVCEQMIEAGRVEVNGTIVRTLPVFIDPTRDRVVVDGRELQRPKKLGAAGGPARSLYVLVNKPEGVLCAASDPGGRTTIVDLVQHPSGIRLFPVGRLDFDARGLVLLTNDGEMANRLSHPSFGVSRIFEASVKGMYPAELVPDLERGLNIKAQRASDMLGKRAGRLELRLGGMQKPDRDARRRVEKAVENEEMASRGASPVVKTVLRVRVTGPLHVPMQDLFREAGLLVTRLTQVALGPLQLLDVRPGEWRELDKHEINALRRAGKHA